MATQGYTFHIGGVELPITPPAVSIKVGNKNTTVELANGSDMTTLKSPSLTEISFTARLPQTNISGDNQRLPFTNAGANTAEFYIDHLRDLKANKSVFQFVITRALPAGSRLFDTNLTVVLETFSVKEDATNGFDVLVDISLKQYVHHATKVLSTTSGTTSSDRLEQPVPTNIKYVIRNGDTLWSIARTLLGSSTEWTRIYNENKEVIEAEAKRRGYESSSNGYRIFPGTEIVVTKGTNV